jgi:hypothetical protein
MSDDKVDRERLRRLGHGSDWAANGQQEHVTRFQDTAPPAGTTVKPGLTPEDLSNVSRSEEFVNSLLEPLGREWRRRAVCDLVL